MARQKAEDDTDIEPPDDAVETAEPILEALVEEQKDTATPTGATSWVEALQADTPDDEVHQRSALNKGGQPVMKDGKPLLLDYVTARFVQDRLDTAVGPAHWQTIFNVLPNGAVQCGISIQPPDSDSEDWITKWDVGIPSNIEPDKGAHSDAFKRAGVMWGIARDLYDVRDEDRILNAQPQPDPAPTPTGTVREQAGQAQPQQGIIQYDEEGAAPAGQPAWVCSIHDDAKIIPAGVSKRTGRKYSAFYACPVAGCDEKGPFGN